ncbi:MAG TPA: PBP1A family penicillin-binding protein, partial [Candidatus Saccharimonadia bacterium]
MASSKRRKRGNKQRQDFYESLPLTAMPPALPQVAEEINAGAVRLYAQWLKFVRTVGRIRWSQLWSRRAAFIKATVSFIAGFLAATRRLISGIMSTGLTATNSLIWVSRQSLAAARTGAGTAIAYSPPIVQDAAAAIRRLWRLVTDQRARSLYLSLAIISGGAVLIVGSVLAVRTMQAYANDISSPAALAATKKTGTVILDRNGKVLFEGYGATSSTPVKLANLPTTLKDATVAAEDPSFYSNPGFSLRAIVRSAWVDLAHQGTVEGGSTITQQLVKNALLTSNKDFKRKYEELLLSVMLTHRYSKDQILNMYLNDIYYGQGSTGVEDASQTYFHKSAHDLTLGESALLAGLPLGPSRFDPNFDPDAATARRNFVLDRMASLGKITKQQAAAAKAQPIQLAATGAPQAAPASTQPMMVYAKNVNIQAPWFVFYVLDQLRQQYGDDVVEQGGITVQTTLDLSKENLAEGIIDKQINSLASHHVTNGSLVSLDPHTGDILAMVGSVDYNAPGFGNVNTTLSDLQPGSSFKPIAYATAFKKGWNGATTIDDQPISFPDGTNTYTPQNYDLKFHGTVTLRHALDNSLNIPAVKVLQFAGLPETLQTAHDMGITTLNDPSRYGLSLVLGGGEVRPIDMATVYATFDNNGVKIEPRSILKVTNRHGQDITKNTQPKPQPALDPRIAYMLTNILSDNSARLPEFPANSPLALDRPAAAKTGTTNDFRDNWTIGYTPQLVTAVWVGNNDHSAMQNVDGITGAAPIWHDYMEGAL